MKCFCGMVDLQTADSRISRKEHPLGNLTIVISQYAEVVIDPRYWRNSNL